MTPGVTLEHDWFPCALPQNVSIGDRSWCYSSFSCLHFKSKLEKAVQIGSDTGIYHGTFFELGPTGEVVIGNYCSLVGATINTNGRVVIHDFAFIAHEVVIADHAIATPFLRTEQSQESRGNSEPVVEIGENAWICARAVLLKGARIGKGAIVGAAAVVDFEVPPYAIVGGNPAEVRGSVVR